MTTIAENRLFRDDVRANGAALKVDHQQRAEMIDRLRPHMPGRSREDLEDLRRRPGGLRCGRPGVLDASGRDGRGAGGRIQAGAAVVSRAKERELLIDQLTDYCICADFEEATLLVDRAERRGPRALHRLKRKAAVRARDFEELVDWLDVRLHQDIHVDRNELSLFVAMIAEDPRQFLFLRKLKDGLDFGATKMVAILMPELFHEAA